MMRTYILTDKEIEVVEAYINEGVQLTGFRMLKSRLKNEFDKQKILDDLVAIEKFMEKTDSKK